MIEVPTRTDRTTTESHPFKELGDTGLLWLINKVVFHPRGYAFALDYEYKGAPEPLGWSLHGDGTEPWVFASGIDDEKFAAVEQFLAETRAG